MEGVRLNGGPNQCPPINLGGEDTQWAVVLLCHLSYISMGSGNQLPSNDPYDRFSKKNPKILILKKNLNEVHFRIKIK